MKKYFVLAALLLTGAGAFAQKPAASAQKTIPAKEPAPPAAQQSVNSAGDYYEGFTKKITYDRMIPPYGLEVTFEKTVHVIFPAGISYVDLGSTNIIAGKVPGSENVIRVKAAVKDFKGETNFSVITEDGSFFTYNVKYVKEPEKLSIEMKDFMHDGEAVNRPNNSLEAYMTDLGDESPRTVWLINRAIYANDLRLIKHIGSKQFGIEFTLKSIYTHRNFLYLHTQIKNTSNVPLDIDFIRMKVVDKQVARRTAMQETVIYPKRTFNNVMMVRGNGTERTVWAIDKITIPDDKVLVIELVERNGGRHQSFTLTNGDLVRARSIEGLRLE